MLRCKVFQGLKTELLNGIRLADGAPARMEIVYDTSSSSFGSGIC